jgi:hypothetical protein
MELEAKLLREIEKKNFFSRIATYFKLSGPGWLQSAFSLGGGSLAGSLYLGVLAGYSMLWLQPVAMFLGIIMLSALGYVTLVSGQRPLQAINKHVNPVLGWGWAAASLITSVVWALPQFSLAVSAVQQNLLPGLLGSEGLFGNTGNMIVISILILLIAITITWNYDRGARGIRLYEWVLKGMVALVVLSFIGVVFRLIFITGVVNWSELGKGLIPNLSLMFKPAAGFMPLLETLTGPSREYWTELLVNQQQNVMAAALSSAVGINMTFLFAYSMLRRNWGPEYKGLMKFDMATGMFIPFVLATGCVMVASSSQFHTIPQPGFTETEIHDGSMMLSSPTQHAQFRGFLENRIYFEHVDQKFTDEEMQAMIDQLPAEDLVMAATLITRDAFDLALSLEPLLGGFFAHIVFGIGVLGMAVSSITLMMLVSGLVLCEALGVKRGGLTFKLGSLAAGLGILGPFFWTQAYFWLAIPVSIITLMFLPIAYVTFFLMMNNKALLGEHMPRGSNRLVWNLLMVLSLLFICSASFYMLWMRGGIVGLILLMLFVSAVVIVGIYRKNRT